MMGVIPKRPRFHQRADGFRVHSRSASVLLNQLLQYLQVRSNSLQLSRILSCGLCGQLFGTVRVPTNFGREIALAVLS